MHADYWAMPYFPLPELSIRTILATTLKSRGSQLAEFTLALRGNQHVPKPLNHEHALQSPHRPWC